MPLSPQIVITPEDISYKSFDISAVTYTSTTATYTATGHTFSVGDIVMITGLAPDTYNGTYTITAIATNTFTVANTTNLALTDQVGNAYWSDPTEYEYDGGQGVAYIPNNDDVDYIVQNNPTLAEALATANTALANAATAYTAATNSLQASAYAIQNPTTKQLTAIDATGLTVYVNSPTSGPRVVMNSGGLAGFDGSGPTFSISASTGAATFKGEIVTGSRITGGELNIGGNCIITTAGYLTATGATITGTINASAGNIGGFTINSTYLGSGSLTISSDGTITGGNTKTLFYGYVNIGGGSATGERLIVTGSSSFVGTIIATNNVTSQTHFYSPYVTNVTSAANGYWVSSSGRMTYTTASSQRFKRDIVDLNAVPGMEAKRLLDLPVRAFRYNEDYVTPTDDRADTLMPGFIAEEVDQIYPIAADYENGQVNSWNERMIVPGLLALLQEHEKRIQTLEGAK